ncbi:MAG: outer membrane lipoprotein LolB [Cocleimonas sp.]|nr:outer membrane lipoprotein LolB [Cocleimonas sp.]
MDVMQIKKSPHYIINVGLLLSVLPFLNACTSQQNSIKPVVNKSPSAVLAKDRTWKQRQQRMLRSARWELQGKVGMRYKTDHWSFGVNWDQKGKNNSVINIQNPFTGATVALITQKKNSVTLKSADGKIYQDTNAERLLKRQTGIELPLDGLVYWARGVTAPQYPKGAVILDAIGRPQQITQANWVIKYPRYTDSSADAFPKKIVLSRKKNAIYVKMIAKKWKIK